VVREDAITILRILKAAYPNFYKDLTTTDAQDIINLWSTMFEEYPTPLVTEAVKAVVSVSKFPPSISDVKEKIEILTCKDNTITESEAWTLVSRALSDAIYSARERFEELPAILQRLVGSPNQLREWALMPLETVQSVVQSNFMRSYRAIMVQQKNYNALPESGKVLINGACPANLLKGAD
jgi:hypothetical protein